MAYAEDIEKKKKLRMTKNQAEVFPRVKSNGLGQHVVTREERYLAISREDKSTRYNGRTLAYSNGDTNFPRVKSNGLGQHVVTREERYLAISGEDKSRRCNGRILAYSNNDTNLYSPNLVLGSRKRRIPGIESNQNEKRRKINRNMIIQCSGILKQLMSHPLGWLFNQPVDPVKLNIPDYFSVVTEPMDLGTVMANLDQHTYSSVEEFEADVRLTFSNAILYNPPGNQVHIAAKKLIHIFDNRWRYVEAKWSEYQDHSNFCIKPCGKVTDANISRQINHVNLRIDNDSVTEKPSTTKPAKMQKDCTKQSVRNIVHKDGGNKPFPYSENANRSTRLVPVCASCGSMKCQCHLQNYRSCAFSSDSSPERTGRRDLGSLRKTNHAKMQKDCTKQSVRNIVHEDAGNKASPCPENAKRSTQLFPVCDSCGSMKCHCHPQNNGVRAFSSDLSNVRSGGRDLGSLRKTNHAKMQKDCTKQSVRSIFHEDGGNKASPCHENANRSTQLVPVCVSCGSMKCQCQNNVVRAFSTDLSSERTGGCDLGSLRKDSKSKLTWASQTIKPVPNSDCDLMKYEGTQPPVSPKKALRVATLLARYSSLIVKTIHGNNADPVKIQEEKRKLEMQQEIEKQKIEDEMKAAKAKLEMQRKKEIAFARETERLALEKMEATIEMDDNLYSFKEFEKSCKCSLSDPRFSRLGSKVLESIGLYIKEDYYGID